MRHLFLLLVVGQLTFTLDAQDTPVAVETELIRLRDSMRHADYQYRFERYAPQFRTLLEQSLSADWSCSYPFADLDSVLQIITSEDQQLRAFSWNPVLSGTWHNYQSLLQVRRGDRCHWQTYQSGDEQDTMDIFRDVYLQRIYDLPNQHYLLVGWGTHGSGHHRKTAELVRIVDGQLQTCPGAMAGLDLLVVKSARIHDSGLRYDPVTRRITHNVFYYDDETGFYTAKEEQRHLIFQNNAFVFE